MKNPEIMHDGLNNVFTPQGKDRMERAWKIVRAKLNRMKDEGKSWMLTQVDNRLCYTMDKRHTDEDIETLEQAYEIMFKGRIPSSLNV